MSIADFLLGSATGHGLIYQSILEFLELPLIPKLLMTSSLTRSGIQDAITLDVLTARELTKMRNYAKQELGQSTWNLLVSSAARHRLYGIMHRPDPAIGGWKKVFAMERVKGFLLEHCHELRCFLVHSMMGKCGNLGIPRIPPFLFMNDPSYKVIDDTLISMVLLLGRVFPAPEIRGWTTYTSFRYMGGVIPKGQTIMYDMN